LKDLWIDESRVDVTCDKTPNRFDITGNRYRTRVWRDQNMHSDTNTTSPQDNPGGLLNAHELLATLWPNPTTRPSLRWLRSLQARRAVPFYRVGRLIFFDPVRVKAALLKFEIPPLK
jgi:hypothetical protein